LSTPSLDAGPKNKKPPPVMCDSPLTRDFFLLHFQMSPLMGPRPFCFFSSWVPFPAQFQGTHIRRHFSPPGVGSRDAGGFFLMLLCFWRKTLDCTSPAAPYLSPLCPNNCCLDFLGVVHCFPAGCSLLFCLPGWTGGFFVGYLSYFWFPFSSLFPPFICFVFA